MSNFFVVPLNFLGY